MSLTGLKSLADTLPADERRRVLKYAAAVNKVALIDALYFGGMFLLCLSVLLAVILWR